MKRISSLGAWRTNVEQLPTDAFDVWERPLLNMAAGFVLAAAALLVDRLAPDTWRIPVGIAILGGLAGLAALTRWRMRGVPTETVARQIVNRVARVRQLLVALPADLRGSLAEDLGRLSRAITPVAVGALTALAVLVSGLAAAATIQIAGALAPALGPLNVASGLALAALLLPGYVRLVTLTAAQRLEERTVLVENLSEIVRGR